MAEHRTLAAGDLHQLANWVCANEAARLALTPAAADLLKSAFVTATDKLWLLVNHSPATWVDVTSRDALLLQNRDVAPDAPTDGQALVWNGGTDRWEPQTPAGAPAAADVTVNPAGLAIITGTDAQAALEELDAAVDAISAGGTAPTGSAGGDLAGSYPNPSVAQASGPFALTGDLTPAQITANQNNYSPTSLASASVLRISSDAARNLTGLTGGADGRLLIVLNVGSFAITLKNEDAASTAGNRFAMTGDLALSANQAAWLYYDGTASRWRLVGVTSGGGGGNATQLQGVAVSAAAPSTGQVLKYDGTVWKPDTDNSGGGGGASWYPITLTPPTLGDYTAVNQNSITTSTNSTGVYLAAPGSSAGMGAWLRTAPATPYTFTMAFLPAAIGINFVTFGLIFRDSGGGRAMTLGYAYSNAWTLSLNKWTTITNYNSTYIGPPFQGVGIIWMRIADNGTNRICSISANGIDWVVIHTVTRTDWLTANQVGWFLDSGQATYPCGMQILHAVLA